MPLHRTGSCRPNGRSGAERSRQRRAGCGTSIGLRSTFRFPGRPLRRETRSIVGLVPDRPEADLWQSFDCPVQRSRLRVVVAAVALRDRMHECAELGGLRHPIRLGAVPSERRAGSAHNGAPPPTSRSIPMPFSLAWVMTESQSTQFAFGYAAGLIGEKPGRTLVRVRLRCDLAPVHEQPHAIDHAEGPSVGTSLRVRQQRPPPGSSPRARRPAR